MAKFDLKQVQFTAHSQSVETRITTLELSTAASGGFWTGSTDHISRLSDVHVTGTLRVSSDVSASVISASTYYGDGSNLTGIAGSGLWTASGDFIRRQSDVEITGTLDVSSTASVAEVNWDGSSETLTSFSSSAAGRIVTLEGNPTSFWSASGNGISRLSDVEISGTLYVSGNIELTSSATVDGVDISEFSASVATEVDGLQTDSASFSTRVTDEESTSSDHETRVTTLEAEPHWTASGTGVSRFSDVLISGSLLVSSSISGTEINWDGASETLTSFSSSAAGRITTLETTPAGLWTASGDFIRRQSDVEISGTLYVSGNIELTSSATVDGVDISEFSSSTETRIVALEASNAISGAFWTSSGDFIRRVSDVEITGALRISGDITGSGFTGSFTGDGSGLSGIPGASALWTESGDFIRRQSDVHVSGTLYVSGNIELTSSATVDGVDISEFSASVATEVDGLQTDSSSFSTRVTDEESTSSDHETRVTTLEAEPHWTASGTGVSRFSDVTVSGTLFVSSSVSASELNWDGAAETLTSFSSSAGSRITTLEGNPTSFWSASGNGISRLSDVEISGTLYVSGNIELTSSATVDGVDISEFSASVATEVDGLQTDSASFSTRVTDEESTSSDHETRVTTLEAEPHWTASGTGVSRFSDVLISGSLFVSSSISGTELNWDGAAETLTSFSSSAAGRITTLETTPAGLWTASGDFIRRQSDVEITGALRVSSDISASAVSASTYYGDGSNLTGIAGSGLWTASGDFIRRQSDVEITGNLDVSGNVGIGTPADGLYTDGFFDTFTRVTPLADAIDEISEAFLDLAPAKAGVLSGSSLTITNPSTFTGRFAAGLTSTDWYVSASAGDQSSVLTSATTIDFDSPSQADTFRGGKNSDITASLIGGVSASRGYGDSDVALVNSRSLSDGNGSNGIIQIQSIGQYNTFWVLVNARINDTISQTGSVRYTIEADNSAGETDETQVFYVGAIGDYPNQLFDGDPSSSVTEIIKYLSGVQYYGAGTTTTIQYRGDELYRPVYYQTQGDETRIESSFFSNVTTGSEQVPQFDDDLIVTQSAISFTSNTTSSLGASGSFTVRLRKAGKSDVTDSQALGVRQINTFGIVSTTTVENFLDEDNRQNSIISQSWNVTLSLDDGMTQVENGRLIDGRHADYSGFGQDHTYYRVFTPQNGNVGGTIEFTRTGFAALSNIVGVWSGSDLLQAAFFIASESGSDEYDLGRAVGDDVGIIQGIRQGSVSGDTITWALPSGKSFTNSDPCVLAVRFFSGSATDYLTRISMSFNAG